MPHKRWSRPIEFHIVFQFPMRVQVRRDSSYLHPRNKQSRSILFTLRFSSSVTLL